MFHTSPEAELDVRPAMVRAGERVWRYIELGLQIPYFLVSVRLIQGTESFGRDLLLCRLSDVITLASQQNESCSILSVKILSPGYVNGSDGYELGAVKEIWRCKGAPQNQVFVMADGSKLKNEFFEVDEGNREMELVVAL